MVTQTDDTRMEELMRSEGESDLSPDEKAEWDSVQNQASKASIVSSAGTVTIWDTVSHEPSRCNRNMLPIKLRQKRPDGTYFFTVVDPKIPPTRGTLKCWLHADDPNRAKYDAMGYPVCRKSNMPSTWQVELHMKKRHKDEYAAIEKVKVDQERAEEREFQRAILQMTRTAAGNNGNMTATTEVAPLYIKEPKKK